MSWQPGILSEDRPPYLALADALDDDIRNGVLLNGTRLPPHRILAASLGLSLSTVTKAYREAAVRGSVTGHVGQGTYVAGRSALRTPRRPNETLNLGVNISPEIGQREVLRSSMADIARTDAFGGMFAYNAQQGLIEHRRYLAQWVSTPGFQPSAEFVLATNGAQHGLDLALSILCTPGDTILVEELTYVGFKALAALHSYNIAPVAMDDEGLLPNALDGQLRETGSRLVYAMPTLHSPTARTMTNARRKAIAEVLVRHDAMLIEDDVYAFLLDPRAEPIAGLIPDRAIYLASLSKIFELGFRAGMMVVPPAMLERAHLAMRASAWSATPLLFEIGYKLFHSGALDRLVSDLRQETRRRVALFQSVFRTQALPNDGQLAGYHVWLDLPKNWSAQELYFIARNQGVLITPPSSSSSETPEPGVRLCLGACEATELERALVTLHGIVERPPQSTLSGV